MGAYALPVTPLIHFLREYIFIKGCSSKEVAFADDFTVAGKASEIKTYWDILQQGTLFGYFPKPSKSFLVVKEQDFNKVVDVFMESKVKVTSEGKQHHSVIISSKAFKVSYTNSQADDLMKQLKLLSITAESEPQSACSAFDGGFKGKRTYFMRTILS